MLGVKVQSLKNAGKVQDSVVAAAEAAVQSRCGGQPRRGDDEPAAVPALLPGGVPRGLDVDDILDTLINHTGVVVTPHDHPCDPGPDQRGDAARSADGPRPGAGPAGPAVQRQAHQRPERRPVGHGVRHDAAVAAGRRRAVPAQHRPGQRPAQRHRQHADVAQRPAAQRPRAPRAGAERRAQRGQPVRRSPRRPAPSRARSSTSTTPRTSDRPVFGGTVAGPQAIDPTTGAYIGNDQPVLTRISRDATDPDRRQGHATSPPTRFLPLLDRIVDRPGGRHRHPRGGLRRPRRDARPRCMQALGDVGAPSRPDRRDQGPTSTRSASTSPPGSARTRTSTCLPRS